MKLTSTSLFTAIAAAAFVFCTSFRPTTSSTVVATVTFGTPQQFSSTCVGRGVCGNTPGASTNGTRVAFHLLDGSPNVLVMTFSLADLKAHQPEQVENFTSGSYIFEADYSLADEVFAPLELPANSQILTTSTSQVVIDGDQVTNYIVYSHD